MRRSIAQLLVSTLALAAPLLAVSAASAAPDPAACGNINVSASAQCEVVVEGGCTARCTPLSFEAECYGRCDGSCTASANVDCSASCSADCSAQCQANPGSFECSGSCRASCEANCDGECSAAGNKAECQAACTANCGGECDVQCEGTPPSASCDAKCEASCSGSCTAQANASCQIECQGGCTAELQGGCEIACTSPDGALFCDGNYVDAGNNLQNCLDYLASIGVEVTGHISAECEGNSCTAEAEAGISCAAAPASSAPVDGRALAALAAGLGLVVARRRKRA